MRRNFVKVFLFLLIGIMLFYTVQSIFTPDWESEAGKPNYSIDGYEALEDNTVDVVFLGNSQILHGISPMKIYEDFGICAYNLATSGQPMEVSYNMLHKVFEKQRPSVILFDVRGFYGNEEDNYNPTWWYLLDNLKLGKTKIEIARGYDEVWYNKGFLTAVFPILQYHTRWNELSEKDFTLSDKDELYYTAGMYMSTTVSPAQTDVTSMNAIVAEMRNRGIEKVDPEPKEHNIACFEKMLALCAENDAQMVLFKAPMIAFPQSNNSTWTTERYQAMRSFAEKYRVPYIDLMYDDTVVDYSRDYIDAGFHLNLRGAEAVSSYLGKYIAEHYDLSVKKNEQYEEMLADYQKVRHVAMLQMETDFTSYLEMLEENKEDWTIVITAQNEYTSSLNTYNTDLLAKLGLTKIQNGVFADSYAAILAEGELVFEELSNTRIDYKMQLEHGPSISLCSSGWYSNPYASTKLNGTEYAGNAEGLNIVVYDHDSGLVIDSAWCNTRYENKRVGHLNSFKFMNNYEAEICFK